MINKYFVETEFKILMYCGEYVDVYLLDKGLYPSLKPFIYDKNETIESLIGQANLIKDMTLKSFVTNEYIDRLKQCQLVSITIKQINNENRD